MNVVVESLVTLLLLLYLSLEALVLLCIPTRFRTKKEVAGEVVLITGAGSGIGRLMALRFARLRSTLVLWDINKEGIEETANEVRRLGAEAFPYVVDLSKRGDIYKAAEQVKDQAGKVDILINNAGIVTGKKFLQCPDNLMIKTMEVNTMAHFWTVKAFLPAMLTDNHGHIVSIASGAGVTGVSGLADYCASKFGAVGFDESLRMELDAQGLKGVKTTVVCPYYINTGMFKGVKTRFPWLLPIVEPDYAVDQIMDAILLNKAMLCIPRVLYVLLALKGSLPVKVQCLLARFLGVSNSMEEFTGRQKEE